jgi:hypothetical protein
VLALIHSQEGVFSHQAGRLRDTVCNGRLNLLNVHAKYPEASEGISRHCVSALFLEEVRD